MTQMNIVIASNPTAGCPLSIKVADNVSKPVAPPGSVHEFNTNMRLILAPYGTAKK